MRISRDDSNWRASGIKHRDNRHDHNAPERESWPKKRPKKPRRRRPKPPINEYELEFCSKEGHIWEPKDPLEEAHHFEGQSWFYRYRRRWLYDNWSPYCYTPKKVPMKCAICGKIDRTQLVAVEDLWKYK